MLQKNCYKALHVTFIQSVGVIYRKNTVI